MAQSDACPTGDQEVMEIDEIFSTAIPCLPRIQEGQLSVSGEYWSLLKGISLLKKNVVR